MKQANRWTRLALLLMVSSLSACDTAERQSTNPTTARDKHMTDQAADATTDAANKLGESTKDAAKATGQAAEDTLITAKVKSALLAMPDIQGTAISVETTDGRVHLTGRVASEAQRLQVVKNVRNIEGVKDVQASLTVQPS